MVNGNLPFALEPRIAVATVHQATMHLLEMKEEATWRNSNKRGPDGLTMQWEGHQDGTNERLLAHAWPCSPIQTKGSAQPSGQQKVLAFYK